MLKPKFATLARLAPSLALLSCAVPRAIIVEQAPVPKPGNPSASTAVPEPPAPGTPDDGIRLPDMLGLPDEGEFRSTGAAPASSGSGAVIARPPAAPPPLKPLSHPDGISETKR